MKEKAPIILDFRTILNQLKLASLPEIYDYLTYLPDEEGGIEEEPLEIANTILSLDKPKRLPPILIDFITTLFQIAIEEGNADAMNDLGAQYYDGNRGFEQSFEKAIHYYQLAAEGGCRQAQENLGYCYYYGRDGEPNYQKAFHYFALGAFDGHLISLYKIGDMYLHGYYVEKNEKEAFRLFEHCMNTMTKEAAPRVAGPVYLRLANMYLNGIGTQKDPRCALIFYQRAESFLFDMVSDGDVMYKKSLQAAIKGQELAREELRETLPRDTWDFDE